MKRSMNAKKSKYPQEKLFCNYVHRICMQNRLEGYDYCIRHILEDRMAPFRQCSYVHLQNGKRCTNAAPKSDKRDSVCPWHAKRALLSSKLSSCKKKPTLSPHTLLASLEHHCQGPHHDANSVMGDQCESRSSNKGNIVNLTNKGTKFQKSTTNIEKTSAALDTEPSRKNTPAFSGHIINHENENSSDVENPLVDQTWRGGIDSDAESVDSEQEDLLKHAGVYTAEEVALITRDKLIRLQSLYIDQFKRLQHVLRVKRGAYLQSVKVEKEALGSIHGSPRVTQEEINRYQKLKAMKRYHQCYGQEALLKIQARERRRAATEGSNYQPPRYSKCSFLYEGQKCASRTLPLSKFCLKHILSDSQQVLYKSCTGRKGDCKKPVIQLWDSSVCLLHARFSTAPSSQNQWSTVNQTTTTSTTTDIDSLTQEPEHFQSMDDIASLGLDVVQPGSLFGLNQFGDPGESTDSALSGCDHPDLMQPLSLNPADILCDSRKSLESEVDK